jgi:hypothetical protein
MPFGEQHCGEVAANSTDIASRSGHEDRTAMCGFHRHIIYLAFTFLWFVAKAYLFALSTERERKSLHSGIQKLDLELSIGDGLRLSNQLV